ncbi:hypothetical protein BD289DRAFT_272946 [Coniella lustricola]|uniref:Secreted protein n=1 Tax=Coniella lustricola TaxID=2025994 RepID=A0A2T3AKL3_9PEZI|nr:hypothetical protein BD289DRAFT_272946 [Coniella lustricola]
MLAAWCLLLLLSLRPRREIGDLMRAAAGTGPTISSVITNTTRPPPTATAPLSLAYSTHQRSACCRMQCNSPLTPSMIKSPQKGSWGVASVRQLARNGSPALHHALSLAVCLCY